jgi:hypothetical protein
MSTEPKLGERGSPVIGVAAPEGFEWTILCKHRHADTWGIWQGTDRGVCQCPACSQSELETAQTATRTVRT